MQARIAVGALAVVVIGGCAEHGAPAPMEAELAVPVFAAGQGPGQTDHFRTHLTGDEEVPVRETRAQGQAIFKLSKDGTELEFKLIVANIENVLQAHIHMAPAGSNGPIVAWLYPSAPPASLIPGRTQGVLNEGTLTGASLVGPLAGAGLDALLAAIRAGNTYVNVHTQQFPPGEIRGQID